MSSQKISEFIKYVHVPVARNFALKSNKLWISSNWVQPIYQFANIIGQYRPTIDMLVLYVLHYAALIHI